MTVTAASPILEARGVSKRFGSLVALDDVNFTLHRGEVHALVGENGAGKSTLMSVLYGLHRPDAGTLRMNGAQVRFRNCADAMRAGIGMVFQHFLLVERFTAAENVVLGREPVRGALLDPAAADASMRETAARFGFSVDPTAVVESLGVGARQQVELLKVLERDANVIILDEPTASLSPAEARALYEIVRRLRDEGTAVALVSHKLAEVLDVADRITVLRGGKVVGSMHASGANAAMLATMMVGRDVDIDARVPRATAVGDTILAVRGLQADRDDGSPALIDLDLTLHDREIVGIAGVEGNGQLELAECVYGLRAARAGTIELRSRDITRLPAERRRTLGLRYIPADRLREGLVLEFDAPENALLGDQRRSGTFLLDARAGTALAESIAKEFALPNYRSTRAVATYSGGMQQKLIAGRELAGDARVVIAFAPTRGVDVGAAALIHQRLRAIRDRGAAVLLVSYDLDEIRALSDRIVVMSGGRAAADLLPEQATDDALGQFMGGVGFGA